VEVLGFLAFLVLFIADRRRDADVDRLYKMKIPPQSALEADPNLKHATIRPVPRVIGDSHRTVKLRLLYIY